MRRSLSCNLIVVNKFINTKFLDSRHRTAHKCCRRKSRDRGVGYLFSIVEQICGLVKLVLWGQLLLINFCLLRGMV
jgi:hypothetical protein